MKFSQEIVDKLRRAFDLSGYEARLYLALLYGARNPKEASSLSGVPLPRVYDIIRLLEAKGLVQREPDGWYAPVSLRAAVASLIARMEDELRSRVRLASAVASELEALVGVSEEREVTVSTSTPGVSSLIAEAVRESKLAIVTVPAGSDLFINALRSSLKQSSLESVFIIRAPGVEGSLLSGLGIMEERTCLSQSVVVGSVSTPQSAVFVFEDEVSGSIVGLMVKWKNFASRYNRMLRGLWEQCSRIDSQ